jgi:hypothetical protein
MKHGADSAVKTVEHTQPTGRGVLVNLKRRREVKRPKWKAASCSATRAREPARERADVLRTSIGPTPPVSVNDKEDLSATMLAGRCVTES